MAQAVQQKNLLLRCRMCPHAETVSVDMEAYYRWQDGELIQRALPTLTRDQAELLISQTCGACWKKMFPPEEPMETFGWIESFEFEGKEWILNAAYSKTEADYLNADIDSDEFGVFTRDEKGVISKKS